MITFVRSHQNDTQGVSLRHIFIQYVNVSSSSLCRGCDKNFVNKLLTFVWVPYFATRNCARRNSLPTPMISNQMMLLLQHWFRHCCVSIHGFFVAKYVGGIVNWHTKHSQFVRQGFNELHCISSPGTHCQKYLPRQYFAACCAILLGPCCRTRRFWFVSFKLHDQFRGLHPQNSVLT